MEKNQVSKNNMYNKMKVFFVVPANSAIWASFAILVGKIGDFFHKKDQLDLYIIQQQKTITGITEEKSKELKNAEKLTMKLVKKAKVWAKTAGNDELKALFSITKTALATMAAAETIAKMNEILTALNANSTALLAYNISDVNLTDLAGFITAADDLLGAPGNAKADTKAGTDSIVTQMQDIDDVLADIDDLMIAEYEDDEADMITAYKNARKIDNVGHYATVLSANTVKPVTEEGIENIKMTIIELGRLALSNIDGYAEIRKFKAGTYHVKFEGEGYVTQILIVKTFRGKKTHLVVEMVAEV